jgi:hypothetical protein
MCESLVGVPLVSEEALDCFLSAFFDHSLPKAEWTHAAHVALAAYLLYSEDVAVVLPKVRQAIRTYNEAVGGSNTESSGYHETLTVFWLKVVSKKLQELNAETRFDAVRGAVTAYGEKRALHAEYYSSDIVRDSVARRQWIEPDLQPL